MCIYSVQRVPNSACKDLCWHLAVRVSLPMGTQACVCVFLKQRVVLVCAGLSAQPFHLNGAFHDELTA